MAPGDLAAVSQLLLTGGAAVALLWVITLIVSGKLHSSSEVDSLRQDKKDLLAINEKHAEAQEVANRLLERAIGARRGS